VAGMGKADRDRGLGTRGIHLAHGP
jgi:hypothetical protein